MIEDVKEPLQYMYENKTRGKEKHLENKVEYLRKMCGISQTDFAKALGVSRQTVSSIENGKYNPSLELAFAISDFFDRQIEEIFIYESVKERGKNV